MLPLPDIEEKNQSVCPQLHHGEAHSKEEVTRCFDDAQQKKEEENKTSDWYLTTGEEKKKKRAQKVNR